MRLEWNYFKPLSDEWGSRGAMLSTGWTRRLNSSLIPFSGPDHFSFWVSTYFDGFGREISTRSDGPGGAGPATVAADTIYDQNGRVYMKSYPYFPGLENPRYIQYTYDCLGRTIQKTNLADGTTTQIAYCQALTTVTDPNGNSTTRQRDVFGRVTQVVEPLGFVTNYQYDALGNLLQVTDAQSHQTTIVYDPLSRKIQMTDPVMGTWSYQYDSNGNLMSQIDAKGQTINFQYDALSRLTNKHYLNYQNGAYDVTYNYDESWSTNAVGKLTSVVDYSGTTQFYYNKEGRTTQVLRTIDSVQYPTVFQYDLLGHILNITYPDQDFVNYAYDGAFNMTSASNSQVVYASFSGYNALGQPGQIAFGNGSTTTFSYYATNNRLLELTTTTPGSGTVQDFTYDSYDNNGNIKTITDHVNSGNTQTFTYDPLNRLATANGPYGLLTFNIDAVGNLGGNADNGNRSSIPQLTYDYDNRVTGAGAAAYVKSLETPAGG